MKKVIIYPSRSISNLYIFNLSDGFRRQGYSVVEPVHFKDLFRKGKTLKFLKSLLGSTLCLNWIENSMVDTEGRLNFILLLRYSIYLLSAVLFFRKVIFIRHNRYPHGAVERHRKLLDFLVGLSARVVSRKVVLSATEEWLDKGYRYLPHPLYDCASNLVDKTKDRFLVIGRIEKYKGIDTLITSWGQKYKLVVMGAGEPEYIETLKKLAAGKNVEVIAGYFTERELVDQMSFSFATILPHSSSSMIVSGAYYHSVSYGVPVICCDYGMYNSLSSVAPSSSLHYLEMKRFEKANEELLANLTKLSRERVRQEVEKAFGCVAFDSHLKEILAC
jgi:glycosyltransferase involved in cell wall biosynthesis